MNEAVETSLRMRVAQLPGPLGPIAVDVVLAGGKRIRPALALAACQAVGGCPTAAVGIAVAVELVHAMSLVHDDLPAMDDADLRRGLPACHKRHGEAAAILVGDALLAEAFAVLVESVPPQHTTALVRELASAVGFEGMATAQARELLHAGSVAEIADGKTGGLFAFAVMAGGTVGGGSAAQIAALRRFAVHLGRAYQAADDLSDAAPAGKTSGGDRRHGRPSAVARLGLVAAGELLKTELELASEALATFDAAADDLRAIARRLAILDSMEAA